MGFTTKNWVDYPATTTPITAVALEDMEQRLANHTGVDVSVLDYGAVGNGTADDTAEIQAALNAIASTGGVCFLPAGHYRVSATLIVPGGVLLQGSGTDYPTPVGSSGRGSRITPLSTISGPVVQLGDDAASTATGETGASIDRVIVDATTQATSGIRTLGRRCYVTRCEAYRGTTASIVMDGQNGYLIASVAGFIVNTSGTGSGYSIDISGLDNKVYQCNVREGGLAQIRVQQGASICEIGENHIFGGYGGTVPRHDILIEGTIGVRIANNTLEATAGHHVFFKTVTGTVTKGLIVADNMCYQVSGLTADTYDVVCIDVSVASSGLRQAVIANNVAANHGGATNYRSLVNKVGSGTLEQVTVVGNQCSALSNAGLIRGFTADTALGNSTRYFDGSTTKIYKTNNHGRSTQNGTGAATTFTIEHGLSATPASTVVTAGHADARGAFHVTSDATNITVTYATAPASGTSNVVLNWVAFV